MSVNALSSHNTRMSVQLAPPSQVFTEIAEQGDITVPGIQRNEFDASTQIENIDSWIVSGLMRRGPLKVRFNFIPSNATQNHIAGMQYLLINNLTTGFKTVYPDGTFIVSSGKIQAMGDIAAPVDGTLSVDFTIRFSSVFNYNGTIVGT